MEERPGDHNEGIPDEGSPNEDNTDDEKPNLVLSPPSVAPRPPTTSPPVPSMPMTETQESHADVSCEGEAYKGEPPTLIFDVPKPTYDASYGREDEGFPSDGVDVEPAETLAPLFSHVPPLTPAVSQPAFPTPDPTETPEPALPSPSPPRSPPPQRKSEYGFDGPSEEDSSDEHTSDEEDGLGEHSLGEEEPSPLLAVGPSLAPPLPSLTVSLFAPSTLKAETQETGGVSSHESEEYGPAEPPTMPHDPPKYVDFTSYPQGQASHREPSEKDILADDDGGNIFHPFIRFWH